MASSELSDGEHEGIAVLKMTEEKGELHPLHVEAAAIELVLHSCEGIGDAIELRGELGALVLEAAVLVYFCDHCKVIEAVGFFNEGVETSIATGEDGKEPQSCCLSEGLSIVRPEEKLCNVDGFPRLPPSQ